MFFQEERPCRAKLRAATVPDSVAEELSRRSLSVPHSNHRQKRFTLEGSRLISDGTGSFVSTESIEIVGEVVLSHGKWFAMTEFGLSPFAGTGRTHLQASTLYLGLDSVLDGGGRLLAPIGSSVVIPSQSKLVVRNFTVGIAGGSLHVDGEALFLSHAVLDVCGSVVSGEGRLSLSNATTQSRRTRC